MTEYEFLKKLVCKLIASNHFSRPLLDKLNDELNQAHEDGLLDEDRDYAPDAIMYFSWGLTPPPDK